MTTKDMERLREIGYSISQILRMDAKAVPPKAELTERELQVITLIAEGLSNHLISKRLDISSHTVKFHVNNCLEKLNAKNRLHAVLEAVRRGYIRLSEAA